MRSEHFVRFSPNIHRLLFNNHFDRFREKEKKGVRIRISEPTNMVEVLHITLPVCLGVSFLCITLFLMIQATYQTYSVHLLNNISIRSMNNVYELMLHIFCWIPVMTRATSCNMACRQIRQIGFVVSVLCRLNPAHGVVQCVWWGREGERKLKGTFFHVVC